MFIAGIEIFSGSSQAQSCLLLGSWLRGCFGLLFVPRRSPWREHYFKRSPSSVNETFNGLHRNWECTATP